MQIVLKDSASNDVTFTLVKRDNNALTFVNSNGGSLMGQKRILVSLNEGKNANRVKVKLMLPSVCSDECDVEKVKYEQVSSQDITVVKFATQTDREDLAALTASLASEDVVANLITFAAFPSEL